MAGTRENEAKYQADWRKAASAQPEDEIEDDSIFEPIQDDTFDEEEYIIKAPKLDITDLFSQSDSTSS
jgi:hypothetical protein